MKRAAIVLLALAAAPVFAQKVHRCGPDGREYSQTPCKDAQPVDASDPRTAAQREQAQANVVQDKKRAVQLERERHQREAAANGQTAAGFYPAPASAPVKPPKSKKAKKPKPPSAQTRL